MSGTLYLCATPIGNLEDMTFRAIRVLREADLIAAEDTRNSIKLLNHFDIHTPMTSYHEYNRVEKAHELIKELLSGKNIALITDAGTPGISDPGEELVRFSLERGITVTSLPGASALVTAVSLSGQDSRRFSFEGFLPRKKKERQERLSDLQKEYRTFVLYEAPHHLAETLGDLYRALGDRELTICRELTKIHEEVRKTTLGDAVNYYKDNSPRGEYVLVIAGADREAEEKRKQEAFEEISVTEHVANYMAQGLDRKEAMKAAAKDRGISKSEVYRLLLKEEEK